MSRECTPTDMNRKSQSCFSFVSFVVQKHQRALPIGQMAIEPMAIFPHIKSGF